MNTSTLMTVTLGLTLLACSSSSAQETTSGSNGDGGKGNNPVENSSDEWSIPVSEVLDGGPGRDGIPALENPKLLAADGMYPELQDSNLVLGFKSGDDDRAYPHIILDWHEIINDNVGDVFLAITYCPLTGTGIGWNRMINGSETTFGVSGLLFQSNLIPFDRATGSNWSQILNESVNGSLSGEKAEPIQLVETDWKTWKALYPNTKVVSLDTGFSRTYGTYPYGDYNTNNDSFIFPVPKDDRLSSKERVHAILDGDKAKVYRFSDFEDSNLIKDSFEGNDYLIVGNENFITSFKLDTSQSAQDFSYAFDGSGDVVLQDNNGNQWNIFGEIVLGPGNQLEASSSFMGYWFSIPAFYKTEIFEE